MIRALAIAFLVPLALAACGQKGDLKLPGAKTQPGTAQPAPPPPASTPAPPSHK